MGETIPLTPGMTLDVRVPPVGKAAVRVLRDGEIVTAGTPAEVARVPVTRPGRYRVEVDLEVNLFPIATTRAMPWIFSNAITVGP
jgi:hypothetical protein